ncbi:MAG TPA: helix-hairpin-helix domain-containing protein [Rhodanobacter sp.]|nr:helix-hairpin-helix domain-containing protein [Rhodanobacter sp.]
MFRKLAILALVLTLAVPELLFAATPVNINQANAATIAKSLDGIGPSRAEAIVAWREAHGPFKKVDDLHHVKGIGKATIERNRSAILLADGTATVDAKTGPASKHAKAGQDPTASE